MPVPPGRAGPLFPRAAGAAPVPAGGRSVHPLHETGRGQNKGGGEGGDKFSGDFVFSIAEVLGE